MIKQKTIMREISATGVGLHSGKKVNLRLVPAPVNTGIVFVRNDLTPAVSIGSSPFMVHDTQLCTALVNGDGVKVATIEHLCASLSALGIDNLYVEVDAPEIPVLDGSAHPFLYLLMSAGAKEQHALKKFILIKEKIRVEDGDKWAELNPAPWGQIRFDMSLEIDFVHPAIMSSRQHCSIQLTANNFAKDISRARTFGFMRDIEFLRSKQLALGGSLDNAVVLDDYKVINPDGLRFEDEFVRHKLLDAVGDLYMSGSSMIGSFSAYKTGHGLNNKLVRELLSNSNAWEYKEYPGDTMATDTYGLEAGLILV